MPDSLLRSVLPRFWMGLACAAGAGFLAFPGSLLRAESPVLEVIVLGALTAGILTLVRASCAGQALTLAILFGVLRFTLSGFVAWREGIVGVLLGFGVFIVALVYDELSEMGFRFGKFLVVGPLIGGACLALVPLSELGSLTSHSLIRPMLLGFFIGLVAGDGAGLGVELAELIPELGRSGRRKMSKRPRRLVR